MDPVKSKANYLRVCLLLVDKGGDALRAALHLIHPPSTLSAVLNANKSVLKKIRYSVINASQWNLLFPASCSPDSENFDVTLLTILLRNICGLHPPATGWNVVPPVSDTSISANIARIKIFRNEVYGHRPSAQLDDTAFETLWQEISNPLVKLGIPQQDIDDLKEVPLSPEEESYVERLKQWKELEDEVLSKLNDLENAVLELRRIVETPVPSLVDQLARFEFAGKIDGLCKKFQDGTRQWFFRELSIWFNDEESRVMILTAGPGIGKSVLSAEVCNRYKQASQLAACHFCHFRNSDSRNPEKILQSLACQMCDNVEGFRDKLTKVLHRNHSQHSLSDAFRVLLNDPLHALNRDEPMLIVVDALDESKTEEKSELLDLISDEFPELPAWVKIFISSRPELQVTRKLQPLNPLEILPDDYNHNLDLQNFILHCLPSLKVVHVRSLVSKCEGSFLYAYYLVNELKEMDLGIEPILKDYVPKSISGFYEKQFKRLKTDLQRFKPDTYSSFLKRFVNVVAASREPLPITILFACMGLSTVDFEIRQTIVGMMSEILPVYEGCLTVYHKSLWDWLTLDGYDEHAFVGDVADGTKRLMQVCKNIYSDIASLQSVLDFQISPEKKYALTTGGEYLLDVGTEEDFHWLVDVRLNFLKLKFCYSLNIDISLLLNLCKTKCFDYHIWRNFHLHYFSTLEIENQSFTPSQNAQELHRFFLQSLANGYFHNVQKTISGKNEARNILDESNELWIENKYTSDSNFKIISYVAIQPREFWHQRNDGMAISPDNKLIAFRNYTTVEVFSLPSLNMVFSLEISDLSLRSRGLLFSPDSSYLLWNSVRSCVSIKDQKEVPLIPHGPESVDCCSFSSCGTKLVSCEEKLIKIWDVMTKTVLVQVTVENRVKYCIFSDCESYILLVQMAQRLDQFAFLVLNAKTLERIDVEQCGCANPCLNSKDNYMYQIISRPRKEYFYFNDDFEIHHFHLPSGAIILIANDHCSKPFTWKDKKCVICWISHFPQSVLIYDFVNKEFVDTFPIDRLPRNICGSIKCFSKVENMNSFACVCNYEVFILEFDPCPNNSVAPILYRSVTKCCALSPDNLYLASCDENRTLTIRSVDNGKVLQTVELKQRPEACWWWLELYLWVVCEGMIAKYPYNSTQTNMVEFCAKESAIIFKSVLKFAEGVLVLRPSDNGKISILKIRNQEIFLQQIPDPNFAASSVAISSDGCAVLLYCRCSSDYQLLETACDDRCKLSSAGRLDIGGAVDVYWFCLTGSESFRSLMWATSVGSIEDSPNEDLCVYSFNFRNCEQGFSNLIDLEKYNKRYIYADPNILIVFESGFIYFVDMEHGEIITSIYTDLDSNFVARFFFYIPSRAILFLAGEKEFYFLKIHNIEGNLPNIGWVSNTLTR